MKRIFKCDYCDFITLNEKEMLEHEQECEAALKDSFFNVLQNTEKEFEKILSKVKAEKLLEWLTEWESKMRDSKNFENHLKDEVTVELNDVNFSDDFMKLIGEITD